ncbi:hypothetical protein KR009_006540 [Drosophila setifemur]|nr:hypothetical protein KR009_006540 [Drosophila setifemur]
MNTWCVLSAVKTVLCVGCTEVDYVVTVDKLDVDKELIRAQKGILHRSGRSSNVSTVLRLLGVNVELFGVLCRAPNYRTILDDLETRGIDTSHCTFTDESPPYSTIIQERWSQRCTVYYCDKPFPYVTAEDFKKLDLNQYGWVNFEARNPRDTSDMIRLILNHNNGRDERDRIVVSLQVYNAFAKIVDLLLMCDYVLITKYICEQRGWMTPKAACEGLNELLRIPRDINIRRPCFICPWSNLGAGCMTTDGHYFMLPAYKPKKIVDRVGDSDCFTAAFIYAAFIRQRRLADAVDFANAVASHKLSHVGFDCVATLKIDAVKLPVQMEVGEDVSSEADDLLNDAQRVCKKYLNRPVEFRSREEASSLTSLLEAKEAEALATDK